jgi:hypothetical protein
MVFKTAAIDQLGHPSPQLLQQLNEGCVDV